MAMGTNHMTLTTGDVFIPEVWSGKVIRATESALVMKSLITEYSGFGTGSEGFGDVIHIPNISNFTAVAKAAQTEVTLQTFTEGDNSITINRHMHTSYTIEDRLRVVALRAYLDNYSSKAGFSVAKAFDSDILAEYSNAGDFVGDGSTPVSRENIVSAIFKLDKEDTPKEGRAFVISPSAYADILSIDERTLYQNAGQAPSAEVTGFIGEILGLRLFRSSNVPTAAGTPTVVHNLVLQKESIGFAEPQAPRTQADYITQWLAYLYVVDAVYGYETLRPEFVIDFRSEERS